MPSRKPESESELHSYLDALPFDQVEHLAEEASSVRKHLEECKICKARQDAVVDGRLAAQPIDRRTRLEQKGRQLAELLTRKPN